MGRRRGNRSGSRQRGLSLLEVALVTGVLLVGLVSLAGSTTRVQTLSRTNHENMLAQNALRTRAEALISLSESLRSAPLGWAVELQSALLAHASFDVPGLNAVEAGGLPGSVEWLLDETSSDASLGTHLGLPRDLNGDGDASDTDVGSAARLMPLVVRVRWQGADGPRERTEAFWLGGY